MKLPHIFLALLLLLLLSTCKKKIQNTEVEGYVTDYYTGEPISEALVYLLEQKVECAREFEFKDTWQIDSCYTNENGYYKIRYRSFRGRKTYQVSAIKNNEYFYAQTPPPQGLDYCNDKLIKPGKTNKIDLQMKGRTRLHFHIKNVNPVNTNDVFQIGGLFLYGMNIDTLLYDSIGNSKYNTTVNLTWLVTKNNIKDTFNASVLRPYKQTTTYDIFY